MKITELRSENVKRIVAVTIKPDGSLVIIKGKNGQGKTSAIDSIALALGGERLKPPEVIRRGQKSAAVTITTDEGLIITRTWTVTEKGETSRLDIKNAEGARYPSPQTMLDKLIGKLSFDPVGFMRLEPEKQAETLRRLVGLDFTILDGKRQTVYEQRTEVNRSGHALKARIEAMPAKSATTRVDVTVLLAARRKLDETKKGHNEVMMAVDKTKLSVDNIHRLISKSDQDIHDLETKLAAAKEFRAGLAKDLEAKETEHEVSKDNAAKLPDLSADYGKLDEQIQSAEAINNQVRSDEERAKAEAELEGLRARQTELNKAIEAIDAEKSKMLKEAKFPVDGLSFDTSRVLFNGLPLEQASGAEQLRVSLAMGIALNPKLKVILIRDGSLLDSDSLEMVAKMAESAGAQVFLERVGNADAMGILIEDGQVAS